jgi:hypothetical protein
VKYRRSLPPHAGRSAGPTAAPEGDLHATRRGGARREVSARVTLKAPSGQVFEGWALNVSKGGVRVILEDKVELGTEFEVTLTSGANGPASPAQTVGRIVWVQEEPDGVVAGIEFCG